MNGLSQRVTVGHDTAEVRGEVCDYRIDLHTGAVVWIQGAHPVDMSGVKRRDEDALWAPHDDDQLLHTVLTRASALSQDDALVRAGALKSARRSS